MLTLACCRCVLAFCQDTKAFCNDAAIGEHVAIRLGP